MASIGTERRRIPGNTAAVGEKGIGLRNFNLSGLLCVSEFFPSLSVSTLVVKLRLNNTRRPLEAKETIWFILSSFHYYVHRFFHQSDTLTWLCVFSITPACLQMLVLFSLSGRSWDFASCSAALQRQHRRDETGKLKELVQGFLGKYNRGVSNTVFFSFLELHLKYRVYIWREQPLQEERQHAWVIFSIQRLVFLIR